MLSISETIMAFEWMDAEIWWWKVVPLGCFGGSPEWQAEYNYNMDILTIYFYIFKVAPSVPTEWCILCYKKCSNAFVAHLFCVYPAGDGTLAQVLNRGILVSTSGTAASTASTMTCILLHSDLNVMKFGMGVHLIHMSLHIMFHALLLRYDISIARFSCEL